MTTLLKLLPPVLFALVAATGNAMFALGMRQAEASSSGLAIVACSALTAGVLAALVAPLFGSASFPGVLQSNWRVVALCGFGLFITLAGFNLLYSRYGASHYLLYAVLSIITTTVIVGVLWLQEPFNAFHRLAVISAIVTVVLFSLGQAKA